MKKVNEIVSAADAAATWSAADAAEKKVAEDWLKRRYEVAAWAVGQCDATFTDDDGTWFVWASQRELADALGIDKSVVTHMKKVVGKYPTFAKAKAAGSTWEAVLQAAYGKGKGGSSGDGGGAKSVRTVALEANAKLTTGSDVLAVVKALLVSDVALTVKQRDEIKAAAAAL